MPWFKKINWTLILWASLSGWWVLSLTSHPGPLNLKDLWHFLGGVGGYLLLVVVEVKTKGAISGRRWDAK